MICDLAETYHVLNYRELSPDLVATLVLGLNDNSRVRRHYSEQKLTLEQSLMAMMVDSLNLLFWTKTKDAQKNRNKPKSVLEKLTEDAETTKDNLQVFESPEDFEEYMRNLRNGIR